MCKSLKKIVDNKKKCQKLSTIPVYYAKGKNKILLMVPFLFHIKIKIRKNFYVGS